MSLNLLLDNADPKIWQQWFNVGIFNGITTNPTLLKKANQPCEINNIANLIKNAERLGCSEFHVQAWGETDKNLFDTGIALNQIKTKRMKVYIKIPITLNGSLAAKKLISKNIPVTFTACYEAKQVLIAENIGAKYIAPYLTRISNLGKDGLEEIIIMKRMLEDLESDCKILVASIKKVEELICLTKEGLNTFTINTDLATELFNVNSTIDAAKKFEKDAKMLN